MQKMRKFDTKIQHLKYKVLREIAKEAWEGTLTEKVIEIPKRIIPGKVPTLRCCVYKERAVVGERMRMAMGGDKQNPNVIEVIDIACDECPVGGHEVSNACRGCMMHRCEDVCKKGAIYFDNHHIAHIDKSKCVECGLCAKVCPYGAIINRKRPCQNACKVKAISVSEDKTALIDNKKCISCGACVYNCPFGAIVDKSYILEVIDILKGSENNTKYKVYAVVAPSIASQFTYATLGQVMSGLKQLGFYSIAEAALGADIVAVEEAREFAKKGFLISSCCPAFVDFVEKNFPAMREYVSTSISPMGAISRRIKEADPTSKVIFIGPCTAKKAEAKKSTVSDWVDQVLTFEELQALYDSRDIDISTLEETTLEGASGYGRTFARCGGLGEAIAEGLKEQGIDIPLKAISCNGIEECRLTLLKKSKNLLDVNFIEGMACVGGCIGGAGCLTHSDKNAQRIQDYSRQAGDKTSQDAVDGIDL